MTFWPTHIPSDKLNEIIKFGGILIGGLFGLGLLTLHILTITEQA